MTSSAPVCPVPQEQQPLQEYQALKESCFFGWASLERFQFVRPFLILWGIGWIFSAPVALVSFPFAKEPLHFSLSAAAGAIIIPLLVLVRLYLGWLYIRNRLASERVVYEESGWYDGQIWEKPSEVIQRDRLIVTYQIQPILNRLKYSFLAILMFLVLEGCVWRIVDIVHQPI